MKNTSEWSETESEQNSKFCFVRKHYNTRREVVKLTSEKQY